MLVTGFVILAHFTTPISTGAVGRGKLSTALNVKGFESGDSCAMPVFELFQTVT
jgi:hypothetical protein